MSLMYGLELEGRTALDIGGYDGRLAHEALRAGAAQAICLDSGEWEKYGWPKPKCRTGVIYQPGDFLATGDPADVVFCFNVVYHVQHPWNGLHRLKLLAREALVIRSSFVTDYPDGLVRHWHYYPNGSGHPNLTVWARPSKEGLRESLREVGFCGVREVPSAGKADYQANDEVTYVARKRKRR